MAFAPLAVLELMARATRDAECWVGCELGQEPLEVVLVERGVCIELHNDGRELSEGVEPDLERAHDRTAASLTACVERLGTDPTMLACELGRDDGRLVARTGVDDDPRGGE